MPALFAEQQEHLAPEQPTVLATPAGNDDANQQGLPDKVEVQDVIRAVDETLRGSRPLPTPQRKAEKTPGFMQSTAASSSKAAKNKSSIPIPTSSTRRKIASPDTGGAEAASTPKVTPLAALAATEATSPEPHSKALASATPASSSSSALEAPEVAKSTGHPSYDREERDKSGTRLEKLLLEFPYAGRVEIATGTRPEEEKLMEQEILEEHCLSGTAYAQVEPIRIYGTESWYQSDRLKIWVGYNRHIGLRPWHTPRYPGDFPADYVLVGGMSEDQVRKRARDRRHEDSVDVW